MPGGMPGGTTFRFSTDGGGFQPTNAQDIFAQFFRMNAGGSDDEDPFSSFGGGGSFSSFGGASPFGNAFGGGGFAESRPRKTAKTDKEEESIVQRKLGVTLEEMYSGTTKKLKVTRKMLDGSVREKVLEVEVKAGWKGIIS